MLLVVCDNAANGLLIMLRSPTKLVTNIPPGVGADSSRPYPCITKYTYSFHHTRILTSSNTYIHFTAHVFMFHHTCIFVLHFVGVFIFAGTMNRSPTAACGLPFRCERIAKTLQTDCDNTTNTHETPHEHPRNTQRTPTKHPTKHPRNAQRTLSIWWVNNSLQTCCCVMFVCLQVL